MELNELIITSDYSYRVITTDGQSLNLCLVDCGLFKTSDKALSTFDREDGMDVLRNCNLSSLKRLVLKYNRGNHDRPKVIDMIVDILKDKLRDCTTITKCSIVYDALHVVSDVDLNGLEELSVSWNNLSNKSFVIPSRLRHLSKLKRLSLSYSGGSLLRLVNSGYDYPSLTSLSISRVTLSVNILKSTPVLSELDVKYIPTVPSYIYTISTLRKLTLVGISSDSILNGTWSILSDIEHLHIRKIDDILELPDSFRHLTNLQSLTISDVQLCTLPDYISEYTTLKTLDISNNNLVDIHHLPHNISTLRARNNKFSDCPQLLLSNDRFVDIVDISCPDLSMSESDILSLLSRCKSLSIEGKHDIDVDAMICRTDYKILRV